jgi:hypothetical protein
VSRTTSETRVACPQLLAPAVLVRRSRRSCGLAAGVPSTTSPLRERAEPGGSRSAGCLVVLLSNDAFEDGRGSPMLGFGKRSYADGIVVAASWRRRLRSSSRNVLTLAPPGFGGLPSDSVGWMPGCVGGRRPPQPAMRPRCSSAMRLLRHTRPPACGIHRPVRALDREGSPSNGTSFLSHRRPDRRGRRLPRGDRWSGARGRTEPGSLCCGCASVRRAFGGARARSSRTAHIAGLPLLHAER